MNRLASTALCDVLKLESEIIKRGKVLLARIDEKK